MTSGHEAGPAPHPKMRSGRAKRLLALDGGGIRGMITLQMLATIERILRERTGGGDDFRLADYFDYVGGTSTGAIIATCISLGMSVAEIAGFYEENGVAMFDRASLLDRWTKTKYKDVQLAEKLRSTFDRYLPTDEVRLDASGTARPITLGTSALKTLLLVVLRNATTDSPWPVSNNPFAKYNDRSRADCNLDLPLWQVVRASTAAPVFFPPETVDIGARQFVFVDGGVTMYNNPAFLLFLMATVGPYECRWETGADRMLLVSVGTGAAAMADATLSADNMTHLYNAKGIPGALMFGALNEQDMLGRVFGRCRHGGPLDREIGTLTDDHDAGPHVPKLFTYLRYNADLSRDGLTAIGVPHIDPSHVQQMDTVAYMSELADVGRAASRQIVERHFDDFID